MVLRDLQPEASKISVYIINDDEDLNWIVAALAVGRNYLQEFDYAAFKIELLGAKGISFAKSAGETLDNEVNDLHFELLDLKVANILSLIEIIGDFAERKRVPKTEVRHLIETAIDSERLDPTKIRCKL
jgi:hypothetical protein